MRPLIKRAMFERIEREIAAYDVVLYLRGSAAYPQCSFSAYAVQILSQLGIKFRDVNITEDGELRQALKDYADWPIFPQLYVHGEFIGDANILREMAEAGELETLLTEREIP
ncbi:MAG: Grx4 family monothiol glutaredoxin [Alphaproteobacteria bacterium]